MIHEKQVKPESLSKSTKSKQVRTDNLRVRRETKKKIQSEISILNKKDFGRPITTDDYVVMAISLLQSNHLELLKERSLSNRDRLEKRYEEHCAHQGKISKDEFIGLLLAAEPSKPD